MSKELPAGWSWAPLDALVDNFDGQRIPLKMEDRAQRQGEFRYYGASGVIDFIDAYLFDGDFLLISEDGANLLARATPIAFRASGKFWVNNHAHVVLPRESMPIGYLEAYLNSIDLTQLVTGTAQPKLTQKAMNTISVPVAPLNEQRRIVAKLDALLSRIRRARDEMDELPSLTQKFRQAALRDAFSHGEPSLLGHLIEGVKYGTSTKCDYDVQGVAVLRIPNIGDRSVDATDLKYAALTADEQAQYSLQVGDVLIIRSNGSADLVGKAALITESDIGHSFAGYLMRIRPRLDVIEPKWLIFALCAPAIREQILLAAKSTSGVNNINSEEIRNLKLRVPPLREQKEIVRRIESLFSRADALSAEVKAARERLDVLEQSVLAKAFRGELVPQDPNDEPASVLLERIRAERAAGEAEGGGKRGRGRARKAADVRD